MIAEPRCAPPAVPGPDAEMWTCAKCGRPLGKVWQGWLFSRHHGREIAAALPVRVHCEKCGKRQVRVE